MADHKMYSIAGLNTDQLRIWIISLDELSEPQKNSINVGIEKSGCTGNTLLQSDNPSDIREELNISTLTSKLLYSIISTTTPSLASPPAHHVGQNPSRSKDYSAYLAMPYLQYLIGPGKWAKEIESKERPSSFAHIHSETWKQLMFDLDKERVEGWFDLQKESEDYFSTTTEEMSVSVIIFIVATVFCIMGASLSYYAIGAIFWCLGLVSCIILCLVESVNKDRSKCCHQNVSQQTTPTGAQEIQRINEISDNLYEKVMNMASELVDDLNVTYDGYMYFAKQVQQTDTSHWPQSDVFKYYWVRITLMVRILVDKVPHPNVIKTNQKKAGGAVQMQRGLLYVSINEETPLMAPTKEGEKVTFQ
eukprot:245882_1